MNEITIGDKTYISSKRAAEITGYAKDYVGQLCREGYVDAKMVGRSWYVYEPSIRAHRFGEEAVEGGKEESAPEPVEPLATWEEPRYQAEQPVQIPSLDVRPERTVNRLEDPEYAPEAALTDMQKAWKEWFEMRNQGGDTVESTESTEEESDSESEEPEDEEYEEVYEEEIAIQRIAEPEYEDDEEEIEEDIEEIVEEVSIERIYRRDVVQPAPRVVQEPVIVPQPRRTPKAKIKPRSEGAAASIAALFIAIAILSVSVAAIGSGIATPYLQKYIGNNPVIEFLGGSRTINN